MPTKTMKVDGLHVTSVFQSRSDGVCKATVAEYAAAIKGGAKFPPVIAYTITDRSFKKPCVVAGFHRLEAYKTAGVDEIEVDARSGTYAEAWLAGWLSNLTHGIRYSNADKRVAVETALKLYKGEPATVIAERMSVSHPFVLKIRNELVSTGQIEEADKVKGRDGKEYPSSKSNSQQDVTVTSCEQEQPENKPSAAPDPVQSADSSNRQEPSGDDSKRQETPEADKPTPADQLDTLTELIDKARDIIVANPELAAPAADTLKMLATEAREIAPPPSIDERIVALCRQLDSIAADMDGWKEDPLSYTISFITVQGGIKNVRTALWASRPCCECPYCKGTGKHPRHGEQCKGCKGNKLVTKTTEKSGKAAMGAA